MRAVLREREAKAYWDSLTPEQEVWPLRKMGFFQMGRPAELSLGDARGEIAEKGFVV